MQITTLPVSWESSVHVLWILFLTDKHPFALESSAKANSLPYPILEDEITDTTVMGFCSFQRDTFIKGGDNDG